MHLPIRYKIGAHYEIIEILGQGGFGIVYKVKDRHKLDEIFIIKELFFRDLSFRKTGQTDIYTKRGREKLLEKIKEDIVNEVNILSGIRNRNIIRAYGSFEDNNTIYSVMEYIDGVDLQEYMRSNSFDEVEAKALLFQLMDGLKEIHAQNIIHRDLKPSNIMRTTNGVYKLIDFTNNKSYSDSEMTITSIRSQGYTALELEQKKAKIGAFSDIYSLGMTLYYLLSGENPPALVDRAFGDVFKERVDDLDISDEFKKCIKGMTELKVENRFQDLDEVRECFVIPKEKKAVEPKVETIETEIFDSNDYESRQIYVNPMSIDYGKANRDKNRKKRAKLFLWMAVIVGGIATVGYFMLPKPLKTITKVDKERWSPLIYEGKKSYSKNTINTVKDNHTGLIWQKSGSHNKMNWKKAEEYCSNLSLDGYTNWRLPKQEELYYLADRKKESPAIDTDYFNIKSKGYWSSSTYEKVLNNKTSKYRWLVAFYYGDAFWNDVSNKYYVLCVR